jgi:hypothetical protein
MPAASITSLTLLESVHHVNGIQSILRHGNGPVNAGAALLEGLEHDRAPGEVEALWCERQGLGDPAAGIGEHQAEGAHLAPGVVRGRDEGLALLGSQIQAAAQGIEKLHENPF